MSEAPEERHVIAAQAIIALHNCPHSSEGTRAIFALERLLTAPGTPENRAAFAEAHERNRKAAT